jgi:hypothetical protein
MYWPTPAMKSPSLSIVSAVLNEKALDAILHYSDIEARDPLLRYFGQIWI